jgi:hypothetical protein
MIGFLSLQMLQGRSLTVSFPQSNRADRSHPLQPREFGSNGGGGSAVMTVKINYLLATYLGEWMMQVFRLCSVTMGKLWMPKWFMIENSAGLVGLAL